MTDPTDPTDPAAVEELTDEQWFRTPGAFKDFYARGLYWELDAHRKPALASAETPPGQTHQRIVIRDDNPYTAARRLVAAVTAADMRKVERPPAEPTPTDPPPAQGQVQLTLSGAMP